MQESDDLTWLLIPRAMLFDIVMHSKRVRNLTSLFCKARHRQLVST